jgi:hypothetical protein
VPEGFSTLDCWEMPPYRIRSFSIEAAKERFEFE